MTRRPAGVAKTSELFPQYIPAENSNKGSNYNFEYQVRIENVNKTEILYPKIISDVVWRQMSRFQYIYKQAIIILFTWIKRWNITTDKEVVSVAI